MNTKLTAAQKALLSRLEKTGTELPPGGNRAAARAASGWWRTATVLLRAGLVVRSASGCGVALGKAVAK